MSSAPSIAVFQSRLKTRRFNISYPLPLWLYSACAVILVAFGHYDRSCLLVYLVRTDGKYQMASHSYDWRMEHVLLGMPQWRNQWHNPTFLWYLRCRVQQQKWWQTERQPSNAPLTQAYSYMAIAATGVINSDGIGFLDDLRSGIIHITDDNQEKAVHLPVPTVVCSVSATTRSPFLVHFCTKHLRTRSALPAYQFLT